MSDSSASFSRVVELSQKRRSAEAQVGRGGDRYCAGSVGSTGKEHNTYCSLGDLWALRLWYGMERYGEGGSGGTFEL